MASSVFYARVPNQEERNIERLGSPQQPNLLDVIVQKDRRVRDGLLEISVEVLDFLNSKDIGEDIVEEIEELYKPVFGDYNDVFDMWDKQIARLRKGTCIVIAGSTGGGKTTLVNFLAGEEILPVSFLPNTFAICEITNSKKRKLTMHAYSDEGRKSEDVVLGGSCTTQKVKEAVRDQLKIKEKNGKWKWDEIHLSWPMPLLKESLVLVDTPGIGESEKLTVPVLKYLPKATAIIFVIDCSNAGGVHYDRIGRLLAAMGSDLKERYRNSPDPSSILFVCNKWELVPDEEKKDMKREMEHRIKEFFPPFEPSQLVTVSLKEVANEPRSPGSAALLETTKDLLLHSITETGEDYIRKITEFLLSLQKSLATRIRNSHKPLEKKEKLKTASSALQSLEGKAHVILSRVREDLIQKRNEFVNTIRRYLFNKEWPDEGDQSDDRKKFAYERVHQAILTKMDKCLENFSGNFTRQFQDTFELLSKEMPGISELIGANDDDRQDTLWTNKAHFTARENLILGPNSPLWLPLSVVSTSLTGPVIGYLFMNEKFQKEDPQRKKVSEYTKDAVDCCDDATIRKYVNANLAIFYEKLALFENRIVDYHIAATKKLIANLEKEIQQYEDHKKNPSTIKAKIQKYSKLLQRCRGLIGRVQLADIRFKESKTELLESRSTWTLIGGGSFGQVYCSKTIRGSGLPEEVAVKQVTISREQTTFAKQMAEYYNLSILQHPNLVSFYGAKYEDDPRARTGGQLYLIMESCSKTIEQATMRDRSRVPGDHAPGSRERRSAFYTFKDCADQIVKGLKYLHDRLYVHRDLKLSNILIAENGSIKLADYGETTQQDALTKTLAGTPAYIAPEVIENDTYTESVDIFALAVTLWEMWYGKLAYGNDKSWSMKKVAKGLRPDFKANHQPGSQIQQFLARCWNADPKQRPDAEECLDRVKQLTDT